MRIAYNQPWVLFTAMSIPTHHLRTTENTIRFCTTIPFEHRVPLTLSLATSMMRPSIFPWISLWSVLRTRNRLRWALARYTSMSPRGYPSWSTSGVSSPIGSTPSEGGVVSSEKIASASSSIAFRRTSNEASILRSVVSPSPSLSPGILCFSLVVWLYELCKQSNSTEVFGFLSKDFENEVLRSWYCVNDVYVRHDSVRDPSLSFDRCWS